MFFQTHDQDIVQQIWSSIPCMNKILYEEDENTLLSIFLKDLAP